MSFRTVLAVIGLGLTVLSGCASTGVQRAAAQCYWPGPMYQDCREMIEFNNWH